MLLTAAYSDKQNYGIKKHYSWLRERGDALARAEKSYLATIVNKNEVHWVVLIIDFKNHHILYRDPLGGAMPSSMQQVIDWWVGYHSQSETPLLQTMLPISFQTDSFSCSVLFWDALQSFLIEERPSLIDAKDTPNECLQIFLCLTASLIYKKVSLQVYDQ